MLKVAPVSCVLQGTQKGELVRVAAGVLVLEELEHARARGAPILAEFLGGSMSCDAHHMTEPQPQGNGVRMCIERWAISCSRPPPPRRHGLTCAILALCLPCSESLSLQGAKMMQAEQACARRSLEAAGVTADEVNYVNAHATSTPAGDMAEYRAIRAAIPSSSVRINGTKSMIGHLLGAAGAVEAVATVQAIRTGA